MAKFRDEAKYNHLIRAAALLHHVPEPLIKAVIGAESGFDPKARRDEPTVNDVSRGLMQLLETTARALGYAGSVEGLFSPLVNINTGTQLLSRNYRHAQNGKPDAPAAELWEIAISAYNAGWSQQRPYDAKRLTSGKFVNQKYVDRVLRFVQYFGGVEGLRAPAPELAPKVAAGMVVAAVVTGLYWLIFHS